MLTLALLKKHLYYHPESGDFVWLRRKQQPVFEGTQAGSIDSRGYLQIKFAGGTYIASRLAYFYMTGTWPPHQIDHKNRDRSDNSWRNLRCATATENRHNHSFHVVKRASRRSGTGIVGVFKRKNSTRWVAYIHMPDGTRRSEKYASLEEAVLARQRMEAEREKILREL